MDISPIVIRKQKDKVTIEEFQFHIDGSLNIYIDSYKLYKKQSSRHKKYYANKVYDRFGYSKKKYTDDQWLNEREVPITDDMKRELIEEVISHVRFNYWHKPGEENLKDIVDLTEEEIMEIIDLFDFKKPIIDYIRRDNVGYITVFIKHIVEGWLGLNYGNPDEEDEYGEYVVMETLDFHRDELETSFRNDKLSEEEYIKFLKDKGYYTGRDEE